MSETAARRLGRPSKIDDSHAPAIRRLYWDERRSTGYIARLYKVSASTLLYYMARHDIPRRPPVPGPEVRRAGGNASTGYLRQYNARRIQGAAQAARVEVALAKLGSQVSPVLAEAARLRISHPEDSMSELAARAGVSKDTIAGRLRRLLAAANGQGKPT